MSSRFHNPPHRTKNARRKHQERGRAPALEPVYFPPFTGTGKATALAKSRAVPAMPKAQPECKLTRFERALQWFALVRSLLRLAKQRLAHWHSELHPVISDTEWCAFPPQPMKGSRQTQSKPVGYRALSSMGVRLA